MWYKLKLADLERKLMEAERSRRLELELSQAESLANVKNLFA